MKYIAFLRAINVSGKNKIKMDTLKTLFIETGFRNILTYLQSGNVIFEDQNKNKSELEEKIEMMLKDKLKMEIKVLVRSKKDIDDIINENPFVIQNMETDYLHVTLVKERIKNPDIDKIEKRKMENEQFLLKDYHVYLYCPNGYGKTKLNNANWESWCNCFGTTRNWKTITEVFKQMQ